MYSLQKENLDSNRGRSMFLKSYEELSKYLVNNYKDSHFVYFDKQNLNRNHIEKLKKNNISEENLFYTLDDKDTWKIDDKRELARVMKNNSLVPKSYLKYKDFEKEKDKYNENKVWFIKSRGGTSGKGVYCKYNKDITENPGDNYIIQEEIENIDLWSNRKYVIRSYILICNKEAYVHKRSLVFVHGQDYDSSNISHEVQVSHHGYWSKTGAVKVHSLEKIGELKGKRSDMYPFLQELLYNVSIKLLKEFPEMITASTEKRYILLGSDYLVINKGNGDYELKIVEVNRYPNISHTDEVNRTVNSRVVRDMISILYNIDHPLGHEFIKLKL